MVNLEKKKKRGNALKKVLIVMGLLVVGVVLFFGLTSLADYMEEQDMKRAIEREQYALEEEEKDNARLEAIAEELKIDKKYILPDGWENRFFSGEVNRFFYKTNNKNYIVVFDENNEIKTIVEDTDD